VSRNCSPAAVIGEAKISKRAALPPLIVKPLLASCAHDTVSFKC
jgi:hypothetical protein